MGKHTSDDRQGLIIAALWLVFMIVADATIVAVSWLD